MVLPLRRYAKFTGRSGRREFWWFSAMQFAVYIVLGFGGFGAIISPGFSDSGTGVDGIAGREIIGIVSIVGAVLFYIAMFVPTLAVTIRRLHDLGISGWVAVPLYVASWFLSFLGWIAYAVVMALPSQQKANQYGPPLGEDAVAKIFD